MNDRTTTMLMTGSSGLLGTYLRPWFERRGWTVRRLLRRPSDAPLTYQWDPSAGTFDTAALDGVDAVIHLAGAGVADGRWTDARKQLILNSRVQGTRLIAKKIATLKPDLRVFVSASAIGIYGIQGDSIVDEDTPHGDGFLADVCTQWEAETRSTEEAAVRTVHLRIGLVLSSAGGMLTRVLTPFKFGIGGRIGRGDQYMAWVTIDDVAAAIQFLLEGESLHGAFNLTAPNPVSNRAFTKALSRVLKRPAMLPVPRVALRALFGREMAEEAVLSSVRAVPRRLTEAGFVFGYPELESALRHVLGR